MSSGLIQLKHKKFINSHFIQMNISSRQHLRNIISSKHTHIVPGAFDALSARLIEDAGFSSLIISGFALSAASFGVPDIELYTRTENNDIARKIVLAVDIPVMADIDNGYGNALNVMRTVREFELAGVASITLEDQKSPKKCPLITLPPPLLDIEEATKKIKAAIAARKDPNLVIVARTDAQNSEEALIRASAYADAGADMIKFVSPAVNSLEFIRQAHSRTKSKPLMLSNLGWLKTVNKKQLDGMVAILTEPLLLLRTATHAMKKNLSLLKSNNEEEMSKISQISFNELEQILKTSFYRELEKKYLKIE